MDERVKMAIKCFFNSRGCIRCTGWLGYNGWHIKSYYFSETWIKYADMTSVATMAILYVMAVMVIQNYYKDYIIWFEFWVQQISYKCVSIFIFEIVFPISATCVLRVFMFFIETSPDLWGFGYNVKIIFQVSKKCSDVEVVEKSRE